MRKPLMAANWKMNKTTIEAVKFVQEFAYEIEDINADQIDVVVCPPFTAIKSLSTFIEYEEPNFSLGAQNMHWEDEGAYTGEVSPLMLKELGVKYVILGHSERRKIFGETDEWVKKKLEAALKHNLLPLVCLGETLEERERGQTNQVIQQQLLSAVDGLDEASIENVTIAYEPIWAIGTGKSAFPEQANDASRRVRAIVGSRYSPDIARSFRIIYGGSVNPENVGDFLAEPDIDGVLVGGASLDTQEFAKIVKSAQRLL